MTDQMLYQPLADGTLALAPLADTHREGLRAACAADPAIWEIYPTNWAGADFDAQFARLSRGAPARRAYAIVSDGVVAGMTAWIDAGQPGWSIEIGNSYLVPACRGSGINGRIKRLMIDHAFACGLRRISFKIDVLNQRSLAAVRKLGAVQEGVLRQERVTWTGRVRDTAVCSILADEWGGRLS